MDHNTSGTKGRLLFIQKYLMEHTDDCHALTTEEIINLYKENGYQANRATVRDDVALLCNFGLDVIVERITKNGTKTNSYYIGSRLFETAELKLLIDAVYSSRVITRSKSEALVKKLLLLTNAENRDALRAHINIPGKMKTTNTSVMVSTDTICRAIDAHHKISFHYWDYTPEKKKKLRHDGELYIVSPYALIWNDDRYYLVAFSDKRGIIVSFRVDRMCDVSELEIQAALDPSFDQFEYARKAIKLFNDGKEETTVTLLCKNELMKNVIDRFGEDVPTTICDDHRFQARVTVCPSSTFFGWTVQYKGGIIITEPPAVKANYEQFLKKILESQTAITSSPNKIVQNDAFKRDTDQKNDQRNGC